MLGGSRRSLPRGALPGETLAWCGVAMGPCSGGATWSAGNRLARGGEKQHEGPRWARYVLQESLGWGSGWRCCWQLQQGWEKRLAALALCTRVLEQMVACLRIQLQASWQQRDWVNPEGTQMG